MTAKPKRTAGDVDVVLLPEIWTEILSRVPAKSILRCRSVCKSWYSLISSPNFITKHLDRNLNLNENANRVLLQIYDNKADLISFSSHDESFMESCEHDDLPETFLRRCACSTNNLPKTLLGRCRCLAFTEIVGSCNGLICLSKREPRFREGDDATRITFLVWNPTIRKIVEVPSRIYCSKSGSCHGFGFDSNTGDYKVVFMVGSILCEVFDLGKGVWRTITISPLVHPWSFGNHPQFYLHGAVHWNGSRLDDINGRILVSFNMSDECYREIKMPNSAEFIDSDADSDNYARTRSVAFDGLVHVIVRRSGFDDNIDMSLGCSVWAMKEYGVTESWAKVFDIDLPSAQGLPSTWLWPQKFLIWKTGEVLLVHHLELDEDDDFGLKNDLVLYNGESRKCNHLYSVTKSIANICLYEESLALM